MAAGDEISVLELAAGNSIPNTAMRELLNLVDNIDNNIQSWTKANGGIPSQANARSSSGNDTGSTFRNRRSDRSSFGGSSRNDFGRTRQSFMDSFESELLKGFLGSDFRSDVTKIFDGFAKDLNVDVKNIRGELGKKLGKSFIDAFKQTDQGKQLTSQIEQLKNNFLGNLQNRGTSFIQNIMNGNMGRRGANAVSGAMSNFGTASTPIGNFFQGAGAGVRGMFNMVRGGASAIRNAPGAIASMFRNPSAATQGSQTLGPQSMLGHDIGSGSNVAEQAAEKLGKLGQSAGDVVNSLTGSGGAGGLVNAGGEVASALSNIGKYGPAVAGALVAIELVSGRVVEAFKTIGEGLSQIWGAMKKAANRDQESREKNLKLAKERMEADFKTMVEYPFQLLQKAAEELYNAWDQNLTTVSATQGYTKADVQDLMSAFAERLRNEGLTDYVSGADLFNNLANVLQKGLTGDYAEEFAYKATVLNKAVPTQDFFQYAETYASIIANALHSGQSQQAAIDKANESLESFASGLLYTTRELTGGLAVGLNNASALFNDASKIAVAAGSDNLDAISNTLLAIQGYVGSVAPDLASGLTDTIYKLATGGNDSSIVALRSLAGGNASNTEFLRAFASNPQQVLSSMFSNLANMYTQSPDAYMEKAEGYASLFGLDAQTFQRVDFNGLAEAIRNMNLENISLNENMELLLEGQTTTTAEQLKNQQVNQYMLEEGLSLVLDSEAGRAIQQHMWDEQLARELMESHYSVDLIGDSAEGLAKIVKGVQNILNFLNPFSWLKKIGNLSNTATEGLQQQMDIVQMLELTKVGSGNEKSIQQLTTYNANLNVTRSLVDMLGGTSYYNKGAAQRGWDSLTNPLFNQNGLTELYALQSSTGTSINSPKSQYSWGRLSKSQGNLARAVLRDSINTVTSLLEDSKTAASGTTASAAKSALDEMMKDSYIKDQFVKQGKSYEDWAATASKFGIADFKQALEAAGYEESQVKGYFEDQESKAGQEEEHERKMREEKFWEDGQTFWTKYFPEDFDVRLFEAIDTMEVDYLQTIIDNQVTIMEKQDLRYAQSAAEWMSWIGADGNGGAWSKWLGTAGAWNKWAGLGDSKLTWSKYTDDVSKFWGFGRVKVPENLFQTISDYMLYKSYYGVSSDRDVTSKTSSLLSRLDAVEADTKKEGRKSMADQLGTVLSETLLNDNSKDPTLQTNVLLGQILVYVGKIMEQTATVGGTELISQMSAMALGLQQPTTS